MLQVFLSAFGGTVVEFFETVVIAYAVIRAGYPREALSAVVVGHVLVFAMAVFLLPLHEVFPVFWLRLLASVLLLSMGLHWTQKSLRRIRASTRPSWVDDPLGKVQVQPANPAVLAFSLFVFLVMLKSSVIEAAEILLVVFPVAIATEAWTEAVVGVACGIALVSALFLALHKRLKLIPEVKIKLCVGLVLSALGCSWVYELYLDYPM